MENQDNTLLGGLLGSIGTGLKHSYGAITDDASRLMQGNIDPAMLGRMWDVVGELPIGKVAGAFGDTAKSIWGPIRTKPQKKAVGALWRADPEAVTAIGSDPRLLQLNVPASGGGRWAGSPTGEALGTYQGNRITMAPSTMRGTTPTGGRAYLPDVMLHESQHFLNEPRLYDRGSFLDSDVAGRMAQNLFPFITPGATSNAMGAAEKAGGLNQLALDEALAYLSGKHTRNPHLAEAGEALYQNLKAKPGGQSMPLNPSSLNQAISSARDKQSGDLMSAVMASIRDMFSKGSVR